MFFYLFGVNMAKAKKSAKGKKVSHKTKKVKTTRVERVAKKVVKQAVRQAQKAVRQATPQVKKFVKQVTGKPVERIVSEAMSQVNRAIAPAGLKLVSTGNKKLVGEISHFFDKISVAVIEVKDTINEGDAVTIEGPQTNLKQKISSMQIEHDKIKSAKKGQSVGMKVAGPVRRKDLVYKAL